MMMASKIRFGRTISKSGSSLGVTLPKELLEACGLKSGDHVIVYLSDQADKIIIERKVE